MQLSQIAADIRDHFESIKTDAEKFLGEHVPQLADLASKAEANPLIDAALNAVHVSPSILGALADTLNKLEADLAALTPPETPAGVDAPADPAAPAA